MIESNFSICLSHRINDLWSQLATASIMDAVQSFLDGLSSHTRRSYKSSFDSIFRLWESRGILKRTSSLQVFALCNLENLLDCIQEYLPGAISTKQARCGTFISFTRYLERITGGIVKCAKPKTGIHGTFKKIREKASTDALSHEEWVKFSTELKRLCFRDYLIAKAMFQGAKRCSEVLGAKIEDIDWENNRISYQQLKSNVLEKTTLISYSQDFMQEIKNYLAHRQLGLIFVTKNGKPITQPHLYRAFRTAANQAGIKPVHPHMLRTTAITLLMKMGYHSDQIMKVSGHATPISVLYYDKSDAEENLTNHTKLC